MFKHLCFIGVTLLLLPTLAPAGVIPSFNNPAIGLANNLRASLYGNSGPSGFVLGFSGNNSSVSGTASSIIIQNGEVTYEYETTGDENKGIMIGGMLIPRPRSPLPVVLPSIGSVGLPLTMGMAKIGVVPGLGVQGMSLGTVSGINMLPIIPVIPR
ncbi:hypothetical protein ACFL6U_24015 [Planctomycetota bacterium]